ncbi:YhcH/YjgK/YiaL family protein [Serratia fonticola]|uniref:YhcH/YjgK/YiaL family protein n=1 Tax=Serratia fonticola TaxID=47917 RepID=A0AAJ2D7I0_SERFO|nr:YhcH/YjgK/YiaL family protein [Serratia fonticola]MDQ9125198.1 YhcH/YjgK/YiaL family protein [Serratia fonticola]
MIFGHIAHTAAEHYPPAIAKAVAYLQNTDFTPLSAGRYEDPATGYVVQVLDLHTQHKDELRPEVHRKNIDVQFLVSGTELIGVAADRGNNVIHQELLAQRDIIFYQDVEDESWLTMQPGNFAVFYPQDVHRPACINQTPCDIRKVVVKIPIALLSSTMK